MQITINISKEMYDWINDPNKFYNSYGVSDFCELIKKGTPLPKGHGALKDTDEIFTKLQNYHDDCAVTSKYTRSGFETAMEVTKRAPTIIEADKEQS